MVLKLCSHVAILAIEHFYDLDFYHHSICYLVYLGAFQRSQRKGIAKTNS